VIARDVRPGAASDITLGGLLLVAGIVATLDQRGMDTGVFPLVTGGLLVVVGTVLLVRGGIFGGAPAACWRLRDLVIVTGVIVAIEIIIAGGRATGEWVDQLALRFGPPEFAALIAFELAIAITLARMSRIRAVGIALLGLLLAMVGLDTITGVSRLTMGVDELLTGFDPVIALLGLFIVADGATGLVSPSRLRVTYGRQVTGWRNPRIPMIAGLGMRVAAGLAIVAACLVAFALNARAWDIGVVLGFGVLGIASKSFGWNRLVLLLALSLGNGLEQSIRQTMLLSNGDPMIFLRRPLSGTLLILSGAIVGGVILLPIRRWISRPRGEAVT